MTRNPGRLGDWTTALLAVAAWALCASISSADPPAGKTVATVNGESITYAQLEPILKNVGQIPAGLPEANRREMHREALAMIIDDLLLNQFLRKHAPAASPADVQQKMNELLASLKESKKTLAQFCAETHQTEAQIRADIAQVLQWAAYSRKLVSDADIANYYATCRDFFDGVTVRASHIVLRVSKTSQGERAAARAKLQAIRNEVVAGKIDFAAAARQYSHCTSAQKGGDIGVFPRKFIVEESYARAAFALKPGDISDVVETEMGLHLIKVTERKASGPPSDFNKIKNEVREFYIEEIRHGIVANLRKQAKIEVKIP